MRRFTSLLLATACVAGLGAAGPALADVTVQSVTGNDATCSDGGTPCATLARAVAVANATPGRTIVRLGVGIFPVSTSIITGDDEWIVGAGGVQTLIRMLGVNSTLSLRGSSALFSVAMTGDRTDDPDAAQTWLTVRDTASARNVLVSRTGQGTLALATDQATLRNVMLRGDSAALASALVAFDQVSLFESTVSGQEVYVAAPGAGAGAVRAQAIWVDRSMLSAGIRVNSGDARVTNSIVMSQGHGAFVSPALTLNSA
ncbi:MAG: hypothetical protein EBU23_16880, partial [Mycobacteriaceae bacterium]|nr:hypothetical protein [Mycobacteriaceae bacterium]